MFKRNIQNSNKCPLCGKTESIIKFKRGVYKTNFIKHHQSYYPEEIVLVCYKCHRLLHEGNSNHLRMVAGWIDKYSHNWKDMKKFYNEKKLNHNVDMLIEKYGGNIENLLDDLSFLIKS